MPQQDLERRPLLGGEENGHQNGNQNSNGHEVKKLEFSEDDPENPRAWPLSKKYIQTAQIFALGFVCPAASSIFAPAMTNIASDFGCSKTAVIGAQSGFVCMLGIGPLFLAPMSETFGRRIVFVTNLAIFTLLQIPTALAPNIASFIAIRTISGFFGSVGVANGGGSISDMFATHERAPVLGVYLIAPLLGPTLGPMIGGLIVGRLHWRYIFWFIMILAGCVTTVCYFFLHETQPVALLQMRKAELEKKNEGVKYEVQGASDTSIQSRIAKNCTRAVRILLTQPIVATMSLYQALIFSSMYSLYSQYTTIWTSPPYNFTITQVGLAYLAPATGFIIASAIIIYFIDRLYDYQAKRNHDDGRPEYRLPMANVGAVLLPVSLFWFGWTVQERLHWAVPLAATMLFGASQVSIFNPVQTYYIDSFEKNAASALAAGAFLRSVIGGLVPLFVSNMFTSIGYGWGMSVFGFLSVLIMPAPLLFYRYGQRLREKFPFNG